jgi:phosphoribosylamine--glycine ligase
MNVQGEPYVIEYNCRMGDPETEVVMPRLQTDLVSMFAAMDNGTLADVNINYHEGAFATVMAVSGGYPGDYAKGKTMQIGDTGSSILFHAGTALKENTLVTNGGRVIAVTSKGNSIPEAVNTSVKALENIQFEGMYYRKDIGYEFTN